MRNCKMAGKKMKIASFWVINHSFICYKSLICTLQTIDLYVIDEWFTAYKAMVASSKECVQCLVFSVQCLVSKIA